MLSLFALEREAGRGASFAAGEAGAAVALMRGLCLDLDTTSRVESTVARALCLSISARDDALVDAAGRPR